MVHNIRPSSSRPAKSSLTGLIIRMPFAWQRCVLRLSNHTQPKRMMIGPCLQPVEWRTQFPTTRIRSEEKTGVWMGNQGRRGCPEQFRHREGVLGNVTGLGLFHNLLSILHCDDNHQLVGGKCTHLMERIQRTVANNISAVQIDSG